MSYTLKDLRAASEEELIAAHDQRAKNTGMGVDYFLGEVARRDAIKLSEAIKENTDRVAAEVQRLFELTEAAGRRMERLTQLIAVLTTASVVAAVIAVIAA
ncbi:MAG: hypothetical protein QOI70_426 [Microbacteriaceae bacterium]|jgi:hypothetical protein|nr:hypothetical protein [Microbacteriaceae bacterium]